MQDGLIFSEAGYTLRVISGRERLLESYRLRYRVFCEELGWVHGRPGGLEYDRHEDGAVCIGLYDAADSLKAHIRLIAPGRPFMLEDEFKDFFGPCSIEKGPGMAEASRFCVSQDIRRRMVAVGAGRRGLYALLFKALYLWCKKHGVGRVCGVTDKGFSRLCRSCGLPLVRLGRTAVMPDGIPSRAVVLDWKAFEASKAANSAALMRWFSV